MSDARQGNGVPLHGKERQEWIARLQRGGSKNPEVWARWTLDAMRVLNQHLAEDGEVVPDNGSATPHYLSPDEWDEVAKAAETVTSLARAVSVELRYPA